MVLEEPQAQPGVQEVFLGRDQFAVCPTIAKTEPELYQQPDISGRGNYGLTLVNAVCHWLIGHCDSKASD